RTLRPADRVTWRPAVSPARCELHPVGTAQPPAAWDESGTTDARAPGARLSAFPDSALPAGRARLRLWTSRAASKGESWHPVLPRPDTPRILPGSAEWGQPGCWR